MFPDLFTIGPVTFHTYGLFAAAGVVAALWLVIKIAPFTGVSIRYIADMAVYLIPAAVIGSRAMYVLTNLGAFSGRPLTVLRIWEGGLSFQGGLIAAMAVLWWYAKKHSLSFRAMGDLWAPGAALGQAIGWMGCFFAGCGFGKPTGSPLAIVFTSPQSLAPTNIPLYPTQLYAAAGGFGLSVVLLMIYLKRTFPGQVFLWYLVLHSTLSLFVERYRGDTQVFYTEASMTAVQGMALMILTGSVIVLFVLKSKSKPKKE